MNARLQNLQTKPVSQLFGERSVGYLIFLSRGVLATMELDGADGVARCLEMPIVGVRICVRGYDFF